MVMTDDGYPETTPETYAPYALCSVEGQIHANPATLRDIILDCSKNYPA